MSAGRKWKGINDGKILVGMNYPQTELFPKIKSRLNPSFLLKGAENQLKVRGKLNSL